MTQLDPSIISQAYRNQPIDPSALLERRAQIQLRNIGLQRQQQQDQQAQQDRATLSQVGQAYASGDGSGARKIAAQSGNLDLVGKLDQMDDAGRKRAFELSQATAPLLMSLKRVPPEQRSQALAQLAPELQARGFTPEHIQELAQPGVLSDQYLDQQGAAAMTIAQYNEQNKPANVGPGSHLVDPATGKPIFSAPFAPRAITIQDGDHQKVIEYTPGQGGSEGASTPYKNGWSPRQRNGGDNSDASVDNYIAHVSKALGIAPDQPIPPGMVPQLAAAMAQFESGGNPSARSNRNNNPGNIKGSGPGGFKQFDSADAGSAAQQALLGRYFSRGQNTVKSIIEGVPANGRLAGTLSPRVIAEGAPKPGGAKAPTGYQWKADGTLEAIPGGPGDKQGRQANLKPAPNKALVDFQENQASLNNVNAALALLDPKNKSPAAIAARNAIGVGTGSLGSMFTQLHDPAGNDFRAQLGRIGGIIIKDTSGAAVSASEDARLAQWVPKPNDTVEAARSKLRNLANAIANNNSAFNDIYNEDNGYRPITVRGGGAKATPARPSAPKPAAHPADIQSIMAKYGVR